MGVATPHTICLLFEHRNNTITLVSKTIIIQPITESQSSSSARYWPRHFYATTLNPLPSAFTQDCDLLQVIGPPDWGSSYLDVVSTLDSLAPMSDKFFVSPLIAIIIISSLILHALSANYGYLTVYLISKFASQRYSKQASFHSSLCHFKLVV